MSSALSASQIVQVLLVPEEREEGLDIRSSLQHALELEFLRFADRVLREYVRKYSA